MKLQSVVHLYIFVAVQAASVRQKEIPVHVIRDESQQSANISPQTENSTEDMATEVSILTFEDVEENNSIKRVTEIKDGNKFNPLKWTKEQAPKLANFVVKLLRESYSREKITTRLPEAFWKKLLDDMTEFLVVEAAKTNLSESNRSQVELNENQAYNIFENMLVQYQNIQEAYSTIPRQRPGVVGQLVNLGQEGVNLIRNATNIVAPNRPSHDGPTNLDYLFLYAQLIGYNILHPFRQ